jgi:phospholipase/carboxylesterase
MNRLQPLAPQALSLGMAKADTPMLVEQGVFQRETGGQSPYALFVPIHYEANYAYPLVVWLHGSGDNERQLQRIMPLVSLRNYVAVGPRGASASRGGRGGFSWRQDTADIARAETAVFQCIDRVSARFHVAPQRIFVAGYADGGTMALRLGLRYPDRFAGALSLGGGFPEGHAPLARLASARGLPLFMASGRDSQNYSIEDCCQELRLFHAAGLSVTLRQYPCADEIVTNMLSDMDRWMMEHVTGMEHTPEPECPPRGEFN